MSICHEQQYFIIDDDDDEIILFWFFCLFFRQALMQCSWSQIWDVALDDLGPLILLPPPPKH